MTTDIHALVGAYALDAIDDLERTAFDRHIAGCDTCRGELDELRETAARLADTSWSVPPPRLRTEVMAAVSRTRQLPPPTPSPAEAGKRTPAWRRWSVAAAAAVLLAGGTGVAVYGIQDQRVREVTAAAEQREARTRAILAAPDLVVRTAPVIGGGKVTVALSPSRDAGVVRGGADRTLNANQALQLWTIEGTGPAVSAGALAAGANSATQVIDVRPGTDVVAVSLEPAGGSATPTTVLAQVSLT
jgi:anti-sigma-K factor RskA